MTDNYNPYQAPESSLEAYQEPEELILLEIPNALAFSDGVSWISEAWQIFMERPALWLVVGLIHLIIMTILAFIPFLGGLIMGIIAPIFLAGMAYISYGIENQEEVGVGDLFIGFKTNFLDFLLMWIWQILLAILIIVPMAVVLIIAVGGVGVLAGGDVSGLSGLMIALIVLIALLFVVPILLMIVFSPILIVFHELSAWSAMKLSLKACLKNMMPFLLYGFITLIMLVVSMLTFGLGAIVLTPLISISTYVAYKQILTNQY